MLFIIGSYFWVTVRDPLQFRPTEAILKRLGADVHGIRVGGPTPSPVRLSLTPFGMDGRFL
jgi:hypothetical protein